jgi:hypothetical protein
MRIHLGRGKAKANEVAMTQPNLPDQTANGKEPAPGRGAAREISYTVVTALAFRNATDELVRFAYAARSLGLASWGFGIVFAGVAVGLRFCVASDMAAPEFVACMVFASLLVLGGYCLYVLESRGYVKLVSEFAVKQPDAGDAAAGLPEATADGVAAGSAGQLTMASGSHPGPARSESS